jgi:hypothetical protein
MKRAPAPGNPPPAAHDGAVRHVRTVTATPNVVIARLRARLRYYADIIDISANTLESGTASTDVAAQLRRDADAMRRSAD